MEQLMLIIIIALMVSITAMFVLINREFDMYKELFIILNKHLNDTLEQQDKAIKELNEILNFKR